MPISLDDAMERAKIMSGTDGLLSQQAYQLLYQSIDEKDRYAFNMALIDHGIVTKTANVERVKKLLGEPNNKVAITSAYDESDYISEEFAKIGKKILKAQMEVDESGQIVYGGGEQQDPFEQVNQAAVEQLRSSLETAGISVSPDGSVSFYKSSVPGVYTNKLPQSMPIESATSYYQQVAKTATNEADRASKVLDGLSRVSSVSEDVSGTLDELKTYKFSPKSQSEMVRGIAEGLSTIIGFFETSQFDTLQETLDSLKGQLEQYQFDQSAKADSYTATAEALVQLQDAKANDPSLYDAVIKGLGGI